MQLHALFHQVECNEWIELPSGWLQGRTVFGGLIAGLLMHKAKITVNDPLKKLLSCSMTFVGPVSEQKVRMSAEILRQGKSVTTVEVRLWQDDAVQSILIASFGAIRDSTIQVKNNKPAPEYPNVEQLFIVPESPIAPECLQQFELAWAEGQYPCTASEQADFGGWFRFNPKRHDNTAMSEAHLAVLFDVWPPGVLPMFKMPAPASSLTWQLTFVHPVQYQLQDWFKYKVVTDYAENGYATEYAHIWDMNNQLIAISRQTVVVFA